MQLIAAQVVVVLISLAGVLLTVMTLPGAWIALAAAVGCQFWQPGMFSWWTIGAAAGLAALGEILEVIASAMGASKAGASKKGAMGAVVGSIVGAIAGSFVVPILGTIVGAVVGAGLGALVMERGVEGKTWSASAKAGSGAAVGRFAATVMKTVIASAVGGTLIVAAFVD
jgi:uncharacterized protein YqgC (DUF456 family)